MFYLIFLTKDLQDKSRLPEPLKKYFSALWSAMLISLLSTEVDPQERKVQYTDVANDSPDDPL